MAGTLTASELPIIVYIGLAALPFLLVVIHRAFFSQLASVPGPFLAKFTNFWAVIKVAQGTNHTLWRELHEQYGPLVRTGPNRVTWNDPDALQTVYAAGSKFLKSDFYFPFQGDLNDGTKQPYPHPSKANLFSSQDPVYHKRIKAAVAPAYSLSFLKQLEPLVDQCTNLLIDQLKKHSKDSIVDLDLWIYLFAWDAIGMVTFMKSFDFLKNGKDHLGTENIIVGVFYGSFVGMAPWLHNWLLGNKTLLRFLSNFKAFREADRVHVTRDITFKAMSEYNPSSTLTRGDQYSYYRKTQESNPQKMSELDIVDSLMVNIFAGADTTAITLRACFYYLLENAPAYKTLQTEIDTAEKSGTLSNPISFSEANELPYLRAVLKETIRLWPGVPMPLERVVPPGGFTIGKINLPAGTLIGTAPSVINTLPEIYGSDPKVFRPERWLEASSDQASMMEKNLFTFGFGSRTCIGKHISTMEMTKMVPEVLRHVDVAWGDGVEREIKVKGYWFAQPSGLKVKIRVRR